MLRIATRCVRRRRQPRCSARRIHRTFASSSYTNPVSGASFDVPLDTADVVILSRPVTMFQMNQLLLGCKNSGEAALVDAGGAPAAFIEAGERHNLQIWHVLQTHAHIDHISGLKETKEKLPSARIYLHPLDKPVYDSAEQQGQMFGVPFEGPLPPIDQDLADGDLLRVGEIELTVHHLPGHSPGHVVFVSVEHGFVIGGDLLFQGSVGRTDLPLCDAEAMSASICKLYEILRARGGSTAAARTTFFG